MKNYAYVNKVGELKLNKYEKNAKERGVGGKYKAVEYAFHKETKDDGRQTPDGTYIGEQIGGNIEVDGKEIFVDKDGIRIGSASAQTIPFDKVPMEYVFISQLYNELI